MPTRFLSIRSKITLLASGCLLLVVVLLIGLSLYQTRASTEQVKQSSSRMLADAAQQRMQALASAQALELQRNFMQTYEYGLGLSRQLLYLRQQAQNGSLSAQQLRHEIGEQLRQALADRANLLGFYVVFEPNALDGHDTDFIANGDLGSNEKGRYALYWVQPAPGQLQSMVGDEATLGNSQPGSNGTPYNSFYTCPRDKQVPCIIDPYFDEASGTRRLVTSVAFPLLENGKTIAVIGIDINLETLQQSSETSSRKLLDGNSQISIISPRGLLAAHSASASHLGQTLSQVLPDEASEVLAALQQSHSQVFVNSTQISVLDALPLIPGTAPWGVLIGAPQQVLLAPAERLQKDLDAQRDKSALVNLGLGSVVAFAGVLLIWLAVLRITRPLQRLTRVLEDIAEGEGDLTRRLQVTSRDELGQLASAFNRFVERIHGSIREVASATRRVNEVAQQVLGASNSSLSNSDEQASRTHSVAASINQLGAAAQEIARNAADASTQASDARQQSDDGRAVVERSIHAMSELSQRISAACSNIETLNAKTTNIGQILEAIKGISEQTNLLALNAAIEAARAGEAGRGFAVVADEVRSLAHRAQQSTQEIQRMIEELQTGAREAVGTMTDSQRHSEEGVSIANLAGERLAGVTRRIGEIDGMNQSVAAATEEQTSVIEALNMDISEINTLNQQGVENLQATLRACAELEQQAGRLQQLVGSFRI